MQSAATTRKMLCTYSVIVPSPASYVHLRDDIQLGYHADEIIIIQLMMRGIA
jgi:hypothetical protein